MMSKADNRFEQGPIGDFIEQRREIVLVLLLYLVLVVLAGFRMNSALIHTSFTATRKLAKNHRVQANELGRPTSWPGSWGWLLPDPNRLIDKYVSVDVDKGEDIDEARVQPQPDLNPKENFRTIIFPVNNQPLLCQYLDAETYIDVMPAQPASGTPLATPPAFSGIPQVRVVAVGLQSAATDSKAPPPCFVILEIPRDMEANLEPNKLANLHLVLRPKPTPSPPPDASTNQEPATNSTKKE
jgi:hypothetical protein